MTLNVLRFRNEQALLCYFYFVVILVIKKTTDPKNVHVDGHSIEMQTHAGHSIAFNVFFALDLDL